MTRIILHSDLNCFYASVECLHRPALRDKPVAVAGSVEERQGIILTANGIAKKCGVRTGEAIWKAKQKCPELVALSPDFPLYLRFSRMARAIYAEYTDRVEPFGIDECWLDVTGSTKLFGDGEKIAQEIRQRMKRELGISVSIGVSWNKIFAKLGSDYKKPDAVTVFSRDNYQQKAWTLPVGDLLYVGPATKRKLQVRGIQTIGDLACYPLDCLRSVLGKMGDILHGFANGWDAAPVARSGELALIKSIGNSCTAPRDLTCEEDAKMLLYALTESVGMRLREQGFCAKTIAIHVRDCMLQGFERQQRLDRPTDITSELMRTAMDVLRVQWQWQRPVRSLGVRVLDFSAKPDAVQLDFLGDEAKREKLEALDHAIDWLRGRFGNTCIQRGTVLQEQAFAQIDAKRDHIIHPVGYF